MEKYVAHRILEIQERFRKDPEYERLWKEQEDCNNQFLKILGQLTEEQRTTVENYIGILIEIQLHTLIHAVS